MGLRSMFRHKSTQTIRFALRENKLAGKADAPYVAHVCSTKTLCQDDIMALMAKMNASVSRQEILVVLDLLQAVIADILRAGNRVATGLFNAHVSISGGFDSKESEFDELKHAVNVRLVPGTALKNAVAYKPPVEKVRGRTPASELDSVYDYETLTRNSVVTPGRTAEVKGVNLDCDRNDADQGVFFVNKENAGSAVKAEVVHKVDGKVVVFRVPELVPGTYSLLLRRGFGSVIREGKLNAVISVN